MKPESAKFSASTVHLEHITTALNCLTPFGSKEDVLIYIDCDGLSFVRECNNVIRIQLFLSKELFMSYSYESNSDASTKLCVKMNHILDSVSVANRNVDDIVECTLLYDGDGSPFVLMFEDSLISERAEYSTYLIKGMDDNELDLDRDQVKFECMIKGDILYAALKDLKEIGCKDCYLYAEMHEDGENVFALISKSHIGLSKIKLPSNKSILEKFEVYNVDYTSLCYGKPAIAFFDFNLFDKIRMSTKIASKVLFRLDANGVLSVNILSHTDDIIISDTNRGRMIAGNHQLQLPKDYPGIVIEVCLMEKERMDETSQREVEVFMEANEMGEQSQIFRKYDRSYAPSAESNADSNLLGLEKRNTVIEKNSERHKDGNDEEPSTGTHPATVLPRFF